MNRNSWGSWLVVVGLAVMLLGGALMARGYFTVEEKHEARILDAEISVTTNRRKPIPVAVSGTVLAVGAAIAIVGAVRGKSGAGGEA